MVSARFCEIYFILQVLLYILIFLFLFWGGHLVFLSTYSSSRVKTSWILLLFSPPTQEMKHLNVKSSLEYSVPTWGMMYGTHRLWRPVLPSVKYWVLGSLHKTRWLAEMSVITIARTSTIIVKSQILHGSLSIFNSSHRIFIVCFFILFTLANHYNCF